MLILLMLVVLHIPSGLASAFAFVYMVIMLVLVQPGLVVSKQLTLVLLKLIEHPQICSEQAKFAGSVISLRHVRAAVTVSVVVVMVAMVGVVIVMMRVVVTVCVSVCAILMAVSGCTETS
jgi:uncharacterized membrane protein